MPEVVKPVEVPTITLPPFKPVGVAKFDATKVETAPWDLQTDQSPGGVGEKPGGQRQGRPGRHPRHRLPERPPRLTRACGRVLQRD
jgi:hypothetical protein